MLQIRWKFYVNQIVYEIAKRENANLTPMIFRFSKYFLLRFAVF